MAKTSKIERVVACSLIAVARPLHNRWVTAIYVDFFWHWRVKFTCNPTNISARDVDINGTHCNLVKIGESVTISSYTRILTHDCVPFTKGRSMGVIVEKPLGRINPVSTGDYSIIGTGSIVLPCAIIGRGFLISAGMVVHDNIPDYSIVIGNPGQITGNSREHMACQFPQYKDEITLPNNSTLPKSS